MAVEFKYQRFLTGFVCLLFTILLASVSFWQGYTWRTDLATYILHQGRIVLSPGQNPGDPVFSSGSLQNLVDSNLESFMHIALHVEHPHGAHLLADLAMSHWPAAGNVLKPQARRPVAILIYAGSCNLCGSVKFRAYDRPRKIRLDLLIRKANNPDQDYEIPPVSLLASQEWLLEDRPGPQRIDFDLPAFKKSSAWPDNMNYIIARLLILDTFVGQVFPGRVAISELIYIDSPFDSKQEFSYYYPAKKHNRTY